MCFNSTKDEKQKAMLITENNRNYSQSLARTGPEKKDLHFIMNSTVYPQVDKKLNQDTSSGSTLKSGRNSYIVDWQISDQV